MHCNEYNKYWVYELKHMLVKKIISSICDLLFKGGFFILLTCEIIRIKINNFYPILHERN